MFLGDFPVVSPSSWLDWGFAVVAPSWLGPVRQRTEYACKSHQPRSQSNTPRVRMMIGNFCRAPELERTVSSYLPSSPARMCQVTGLSLRVAPGGKGGTVCSAPPSVREKPDGR